MSEAPERIMAYGEINSKWGVQFKCNPMPMQGMPPFPYTEYVRADRIEELESKLAKAAEGIKRAKGFYQVTHIHAGLDAILAELKGQGDE